MSELPILYLRQGDIYFGGFEGEIRTILGSCVSVVLLHPSRHLGGICHIVLPEHDPNNAGENCDKRYADCAINEFVKQIERSNTHPGDYWTGVYGGGNMFPSVNYRDEELIGNKNIKRVCEYLKEMGFRISDTDLGGNIRRKLILNIHLGKVKVVDTEMNL